MPRSDAEIITSTENPAVRLAQSLLDGAGRKRHGAFLVEGLRLVEAACDALRPRLVLHRPQFGQADARERALLRRLRDGGAAVRPVSERVLAHVTDTVTPQGIVAVVPVVPVADQPEVPDSGDLALVLDGVTDPGNAGTLLRSAAGAGVRSVLASRGTVDLYAPKVVRAGAGGHFQCRLVTGLTWDAIGRRLKDGYQVLLADARATRRHWEVDWTRRSALIVSNEARGASREAAAAATERIAIPVRGVESLNVGVAGSVMLFEALRQRITEVEETDGRAGR